MSKNRRIVFSKANAARLTIMFVVAGLLCFAIISSVHFIDKLFCKECSASLIDSMVYAMHLLNPLHLIIAPLAVLVFPHGTVTMGLSFYLTYLTWKKWERRVVYVYLSISILIMYVWYFFFDAMAHG